MNYWLFLLPFTGAMIGWGIGKIATWFLFYPVKQKKFLGITVRGLWPSRQPAITEAISRFIVQEFSSLNLEQRIADPSNLLKARPVIESHIDNFLRVKLKDQMPMISMFIGDKTIESLKSIFMQELENLFPEVMKHFAGNMKPESGIDQMVRQKLSGISSTQLKMILSDKLYWIANLCAITGFITGMIQMVLILLFF